MLNKLSMYIIGTLLSILILVGGIAWYRGYKLEGNEKTIEVLQSKVDLAPIENNITSIASKASGVIEQIEKEDDHEEDTTIGTHTSTF